MTIKASALLSIIAIWAAMIPAVAVEHASWWALIFAALATGAVGTGAFRSLGMSRLLAIAGAWAGSALAAGSTPDGAWTAIFAFLTTGAVVYSVMRKDAVLNGLGIAVAWLVVGLAVMTSHAHEGAWTCVFAFLTAGAVANHRTQRRGVAAAGWWAIAGVIMIAAQDYYWLSVFAFLLSTVSLGFGNFSFPRRLEWDLFERDDDGRR
jgi:hypothetical protein